MAKFRYRNFKSARREETKSTERAIARADKDFKAGKTLKDNPYKGFNQKYEWNKRFVSLLAI